MLTPDIVLSSDDEQPDVKNDVMVNDFDVHKEFDTTNEYAKTAYDIFREKYKTAFEPCYVSDIVNGETIQIKNDNILVSEYIDHNDHEDMKIVNIIKQQAAYCTKKLYDYQINTIASLVKLERDGFYINKKNNEKVVSNSWIISLPIGSGKSLVFMFLALWYRNSVPTHSIIVSKTGNNVPIYEPISFKDYPYYYEGCSYIERTDKDGNTYCNENAVITLDNYSQRKTTIILTHDHLVYQMKNYFKQDFPKFVGSANCRINFASRVEQIKETDDIVVIVANEQNVGNLVKLSYEQPFMRVIIDDYTSMSGIDSFREILASSTIFVSGCGFERKPEEIPTSYYTLKHQPTHKISLVGKPQDTYVGVVRNNIAMIKLNGSICSFSMYEFVKNVDNMCISRYNNALPLEVYPPIKSTLLKDYMSLWFIINNINRLRSAISNISTDYLHPKGKHKNERSEISYFIEWTKHISQKGNPLYNDLFDRPDIIKQEPTPIVIHQDCMCCKKDEKEHNYFGCVATCCGAFYCEYCLKNMTTRAITDKTTGDVTIDNDNYYCSCCRAKNPVFYINITKKKDKSVFAYNLIDNFFVTDKIKNHIKFDYYFYMLQEGLVPIHHGGNPVNIHIDIERGNISKHVFDNPVYDGKYVFDRIHPIDSLMMHTLHAIDKTLTTIGQSIEGRSYILFYNTPEYMQKRIENYFKTYTKGNSPLAHVYPLFCDSISSLIGIHVNILGIIVFNFKATSKDGIKQLFGRCARINTFNNKVVFFITPDNISN